MTQERPRFETVGDLIKCPRCQRLVPKEEPSFEGYFGTCDQCANLIYFGGVHDPSPQSITRFRFFMNLHLLCGFVMGIVLTILLFRFW